MRRAALLLFALIFAGCSPAFASPLDVAKAFTYVREETNRNDAPEIDGFLAHAGLGPGYPWCQAFAAYCVDADAGRRVMPKSASVYRTVQAVLRDRLTYATVAPRQVLLGAKPPKGALIAFKHGPGADAKTFTGNGHAAINVDWAGAKGRTIEGNTKAGPEGDQRGAAIGDLRGGHDGVYYRNRGLGLEGNFPIVLFYWPRG